MVKVLFDTNILIDYLKGVEVAREELERYRQKSISIITWMEVLAGTRTDHADIVKKWLLDFKIEKIDDKIADRAVAIRKEKRIRLPDAVIWATAQILSATLVTRNTKDFPEKEMGIRVPYNL